MTKDPWAVRVSVKKLGESFLTMALVTAFVIALISENPGKPAPAFASRQTARYGASSLLARWIIVRDQIKTVRARFSMRRSGGLMFSNLCLSALKIVM